MHRIKKSILIVLYLFIGATFGIISISCERKKFLNPCDPENLPPAPQLLSPANNTTSIQNPPLFQWSIEEDTLNPLYGEQLIFEIQIDNNQNFSSVDFVDSIIHLNTVPYSLHIGEGDYYWRVRAQYLDGNWGEWSAIHKFNVRFPLIGSCPYNIYSQRDMAATQNFVFVTNSSHNLYIIDISSPYNPTLSATYSDTTTAFYYVFISGNYLYTTDTRTDYGFGSFSVYDITNPLNPILLARYNLETYDPADLWVENEKAYICCRSYPNILVFDVSNPESVYVAYELPANGTDIIIKQNYAFVLYYYDFRVVDLTNNTIISTVNLSGQANSFCLYGNYLYIAGDNTWIYDISDPYNPLLISTINSYSYAIYALDNYLFFNEYDITYYSLLHIFDITDVLMPEELGTVLNVYGELYADGNFVYISGPRLSIIKYE